MAENDDDKLLVDTFGEDKVMYSERTISRVQNDLDWTFITARYCQAIRDANKQKRVDWVNLPSLINAQCSWSVTTGSPFTRKML